MRRGLLWLLTILVLGLHAPCVSAIDVGWMQRGVRVWYLGAAGSSNAEEAYRFDAVVGNDLMVTRHSAVNHWESPLPVETQTHPLGGHGPCWIHPLALQNLKAGDSWMGQEITLVSRATYTYGMIPYAFLPAKALFDLKPQREVVKIQYMIPFSMTGTAFFDAETGILLLYSRMSGYITVFFILSEINYDFARQVAFPEDEGPHTGFRSEVIESSLGVSWSGGGMVSIHSLVETRYGSTVEMRTLTSVSASGSKQADENYCFFGSVPVLRRMNADQAPNLPPEEWIPSGEYLWWWIPPSALKRPIINVLGVTMQKTGPEPHAFTATEEPPGFFFKKIWFGDDGYMTMFSAKDISVGLALDPGDDVFRNLTTVKGLSYYRGAMGRATPDSILKGDVDDNLFVDIADALLASRLLAGFELPQELGPEADVDGDGLIGLPEMIYILQRISNRR